MPVLSVIVPVYNTAPYLQACAQSILAQSLADLELILVDDGSTDGSGFLCDVLAAADRRVVVLHTDNGGVSAARNRGLDRARGDFIGFVDSDDALHPAMYARLYRAARDEGADIACCGYRRTDENLREHGEPSVFPESTLNGLQALEYLFTDDYVYFTIPCNKLFKAALFADYRFPTGKRYEDGHAAFRLLQKSGTVVCLPEALYSYRTHAESFTQAALTVTNLDALDSVIDAVHFFTEKGLSSLAQKAQIKLVAGLMRNVRRFDLGQPDIAEKFRAIHRDFLPLYHGILKIPDLTRKEKLLVTAFRLSPRLCKRIIEVRHL